MFIKTVKIKSFWAAVTVLAIVAVAAAAVLFAFKHAQEKTAAYRMTNETQRQEFIKDLGWKVSDEYDTCRIVIIPEQFDEVYKNYNDLQKQQGFDLSEYKGRTVEIYSYPVYNYEGEQNVMMNLMICDGMLIGGDVCCTELDGFMHGLKKPKADTATTDSAVTQTTEGAPDVTTTPCADDALAEQQTEQTQTTTDDSSKAA